MFADEPRKHQKNISTSKCVCLLPKRLRTMHMPVSLSPSLRQRPQTNTHKPILSVATTAITNRIYPHYTLFPPKKAGLSKHSTYHPMPSRRGMTSLKEEKCWMCAAWQPSKPSHLPSMPSLHLSLPLYIQNTSTSFTARIYQKRRPNQRCGGSGASAQNK